MLGDAGVSDVLLLPRAVVAFDVFASFGIHVMIHILVNWFTKKKGA